MDKGMLGASGIGTPPVAVGQLATVSAGSGPVTIAGQSPPNIGDVTVGIRSSATTDVVTGKISSAIASLARSWSGKNVTIGALPLAVIAAGIWFAYCVGGGLYDVASAAAAMLSVAGIVVAVGSYGPITDTVAGSRGWPSWCTRCAPSPMRSTP